MSSNAVPTELISRIVGYQVEPGDFSTTTPNLPQRVLVLGEATEAKQTGLVTDATRITSAKQAGDLYGYGSPLHSMARIFFPPLGGGIIGGIPVYFAAQAKASGAAARVQTVTVTGTATANGTHKLVIGGRYGLDGENYDVNIVTGDTADDIATKISDVINNVLGCPLSASTTDEVATVTTKWNGLTAQDVSISVDTNNTSLGVTYAVAQTAAGSGTPSISTALTAAAGEWNTILVNGYGAVTAIMDALEAANGIASATTPSGRYTATIFKPFIAYTGSTEQDPSSLTDSRLNNMTISIAPAPLSKGMPYEAAANMAVLSARCAQDTPHLDVGGMSYPDMPVPADGVIGAMSDYLNRDAILKKGCSTVDLVAGVYQIQDPVTTYHPQGETVPQHRYNRDIMLDWNVRYGVLLLEQKYVRDHVIAADNAQVTAPKVVKPKGWKVVLKGYAADLERRALIARASFMQESTEVNVGASNPNRLETFFRYERTGTARISSTTAQAGFNFGTNG